MMSRLVLCHQENVGQLSSRDTKKGQTSKSVSFAFSSTPGRGPLTNRNPNVERRAPTPGKPSHKRNDSDDEHARLSHAYAALRHQYDALSAEMKRLRGSPEKDKDAKYQKAVAEKEALEEKFHEQRDLLNTLMAELDAIFPNINSDITSVSKKKQVVMNEDENLEEAAVSRYVEQCIGTVAEELARENMRQEEEQRRLSGLSSSDGVVLTPLPFSLPLPVSLDSQQEMSLSNCDTPCTEESFLSSTNSSQDSSLHLTSALQHLSPVHCSLTTHHNQSIQVAPSPILTVNQSTEMSRVMTVDNGTSTDHPTMCDAIVETKPIETCSVATEMCLPPIDEYQVKYFNLEAENKELQRDLSKARQQVEKISALMEEFQFQESYKERYYCELQRNKVLEEDLDVFHMMMEKIQEAEKFQIEFASAMGQIKAAVGKYIEDNHTLKEQIQCLEEELSEQDKKLAKLQHRESQLVTEVGKLLVELTTVKSQHQLMQDKLTTEATKAEKYAHENNQLSYDNERLKCELDENGQAAVLAIETLQDDVRRLKAQCQDLEKLKLKSGEMQEFLEAERLTMCEEVATLHSAARRSMLQQDEELVAVARAVRELWDKFLDSICVLSMRSGTATEQQTVAMKRRSLLSSDSLVDRVLAGKMLAAKDSRLEWGDQAYAGLAHLIGHIDDLQKMVTELQDLGTWKTLKQTIATLEREKKDLISELNRCQSRINQAIKSLDETKANLRRRDEQYKQLKDVLQGSDAQRQLEEMKEKKQHYKSRLKELIAFGDEYKDRMEKKVELLKSNLAKSESEVGSLDQIVEHTRKTLHLCFGTVKTSPKLEKLLQYLDGTAP
ncbi:centrosomal protein of 290 kDa-like isoform X2 [Corticium candelabrum]|uniref:centrosomal protein of 290 kDa-like isoform X2 n=1 Tax=Corticium candelabrum TaxID=121492 RepID=UPI002E25C8CB|nr:centrosomal protein of 290 kDa-like isoform X2 [Corticium candelabrum]